MKEQHYRIALGVILVAATLIRVWGLSYDLPMIYHPDAPDYIRISQRIFKTGDLNPKAFNYPSLFFYLQALAYGPYYAVGRALGHFEHRADIAAPTSYVMGVTHTAMPSTVLLGRGLTVAFAVGSVLLAAAIGRQLTGRPLVGLLAGAMLALSRTHVFNSRYITPDAVVTFFALLTTWFAVKVLRVGRTWHYLAGGVALGLTTGSKYNGALTVLPLVTAHLLRNLDAEDRRGWLRALLDPRIYAALALGGVIFLLTTPFALLDFPTFVEDFTYEAQHYATGHTGQEGDTLRFYLTYLWRNTRLISLLALLSLTRIVKVDRTSRRERRLRLGSRATLLLAVFPVVYFVFINRFVVRNDRTLMPFLPFLFLLAAGQLGTWWRWAGLDAGADARHRRRLVVVALVTLATLLPPAALTLTRTARFAAPDSRKTARVWIDRNLPPGARIAIEAYAPYVDGERFFVRPVGRMIDHPPDWYREQGIDYLVFAEGMFGRFYNDTDRYADQVAQYEMFFEHLEHFTPVKSFDDGGYDVYVYRVNDE